MVHRIYHRGAMMAPWGHHGYTMVTPLFFETTM